MVKSLCKGLTLSKKRCSRLVENDLCHQHIKQVNNTQRESWKLNTGEIKQIKTHVQANLMQSSKDLTMLEQQIAWQEKKLHLLKNICDSWKAMVSLFHDVALSDVCFNAIAELCNDHSCTAVKLNESLKPQKMDLKSVINQLTKMMEIDWAKYLSKARCEFDCTICQEHGQPVGVEMSCHHAFHTECIIEHLSRKMNCPNCRQILQPIVSIGQRLSALQNNS